MVKRKCEVCKKFQKPDQITRTFDGEHAICLRCYNETSELLRKSGVNYKECIDSKAFLLAYKRLLYRYLISVEGWAYLRSTGLEMALDAFLKVESSIAETKYLKDRTVLYKQEHFEVMKEVMKQMGVEQIKKGQAHSEHFDSNEITKMHKKYKRGRAW